MVDGAKFRSISEIEQMQEEMSVLAGLKHPNIIRLHDVSFTNNVFYMVMELGTGGTLMDYIRGAEGGKLPEEEARRVFNQMVGAMDYCHRR
jgi:serine/threonine protein kinase